MTCDEVAADSTELALGLLDGAPRAAIIDHLAHCAACRRRVEVEAALLDQLLTAGPTVEPPAGFDARVLERIARESRSAEATMVPLLRSPSAMPRPPTSRPGVAHRWRRRVLLAAAAVVLVIAGIGIGVRHRGAAPDVRAATMVTAEGRPVGQAVVASRPGTLIVSAPAWARSGWRGGEVYVRVTLASGAVSKIETTRLNNGVWVAPLAVDGSLVRRVAMLDDRGWVVCEARLAA